MSGDVPGGLSSAVEQASILGVPVDVGSTQSILDRLIARAKQRAATRVFYVNAHVLNMITEDPGFRAEFERADVVLADGYGARLAARWLGQAVPERVAITDCVWEFFEKCADTGTRVGVVAGKPGVADRAVNVLRERYPSVQIVAVHHGYLADDATSAAAVAEIRAAKPDVLCVGMGSPIQERWINRHAEDLGVPVIFAVGAVMDYVSGEVRRARPTWLSDNGFEWVGRLAAEPRRMWRRYLLGNPKFLWRVLREWRRSTRQR